MSTARLILVAILMVGLHSLGATTVEQYQQGRAKSDSADALLNGTYIKGLVEGIEVANTSLLYQAVMMRSGSTDHPEWIQLYCPATTLSPETTNFTSILDDEIKRRLDLAVDPTERQKVMQTSISVVLLEGIIRTFPCNSDNIKGIIETLLRSLDRKKK